MDLFKALCAPFAARGLAHLLGIEAASDAQMIYWSQTLINGAGNFGSVPALFAETDKANAEMDALFDELVPVLRAEPNMSALSVMVNAPEPIEMSQIYSNIKIAIGGGLNEPRDALATILFGLLADPEQRAWRWRPKTGAPPSTRACAGLPPFRSHRAWSSKTPRSGGWTSPREKP